MPATSHTKQQHKTNRRKYSWREWFSLSPMGVRSSGPRKRRRHSVLSLGDMSSYDEWVASLAKKQRRTFVKNIPSVFDVAEPVLTVRTIPAAKLAWSVHFPIVVDHERRMYPNSWLLGFYFAAAIRFLVAKAMDGVIDEYVDRDGNVQAWAQTIAKGNTIRGMWFYQNEAVNKNFIWFHSLRTIVKRGFSSPDRQIKWVDIGPSGNKEIRKVKAEYGFVDTGEWGTEELACYDGNFIALPDASIL
eukprot:m.214655 g.214655  ORF g.214655 m.214655 type:complete len:245 (+) comp15871_c0_seq2:253-987(+)